MYKSMEQEIWNRYPAFYIGKSVRFHYPGTKVQELKAYLQ